MICRATDDQRWDATAISLPAGLAATDLATDSAGNTFVTGVVGTGVDSEVWVGKYDSAGMLAWSDSYGEAAGASPIGMEYVAAISVDGAGHVVAAGSGFSGSSFTTDINVGGTPTSAPVSPLIGRPRWTHSLRIR